jgi:hypothetical protein
VWGLRSPRVGSRLSHYQLTRPGHTRPGSRRYAPSPPFKRLPSLLSGPPCCVRVCAVREASSRVSPPHRPREDRLAHPDTSKSNPCLTLGLLPSGFRVAAFQTQLRRELS